jgi:hypothetical protein
LVQGPLRVVETGVEVVGLVEQRDVEQQRLERLVEQQRLEQLDQQRSLQQLER